MLVKIACWSDRHDGSQLRGMQKIGGKWDEDEREGWRGGTKGIACSPKNEEQERNLLPVTQKVTSEFWDPTFGTRQDQYAYGRAFEFPVQEETLNDLSQNGKHIDLEPE